MSLSSAVATTTSQIPKVVTTTSRVPQGVTTISRVSEVVTTTSRVSEVVTITSKVPEAVTTTSKSLEVVTTESAAPPPPPVAVAATATVANEMPILVSTPIPASAPAVPSDANIKEKNKDDKDKKSDEGEEEEEKENDESPNINGIPGIQAVEGSDSRHVSRLSNGQVVDARAGTVNKKKFAVVEELQKRINEIVKEQNAPFEAELSRIMADLFDSRDAASDKDATTQTTFHVQADGVAPAPGINPRELLNTLLQPFIIQLRTDVRNTINGNGDYAKKAAQDDITTTTHPDEVHFADLYDPNTAALALDCLETHFERLTTALGKLLKDKDTAAFATAVAVAVGDASSSEAEKERIERSGAFAQWLVDSMVHEFQLAVERGQDLASGDRRNIAAVANLPDAEKKAQVQSKEEETSRPPTAAGAAAREPS
ncbi:hypothetical protein BGZ47_001465 [Haplosporangium gracile]|nr:hypothetical protein BGZ47_001465 [Haplosporangium gracile]